MDYRFDQHNGCCRLPRDNGTQTRIIVKTTRKRKIKQKSRTRYGSALVPFGCVVAGLIVFHFFSVQLARGFYEEPVQISAIVPQKSISTNEQSAIGLPVRITIPRIALDTNVETIGLTADGAMGVPKHPRNTAWYMLGPKPGEQGSAVIAGHVSWLYGAESAFKNLKTLKPGDTITIKDDHGAIITFVVRETKIYGARADATTIFSSNDGKAHLNLITCAGVWDKIAKQYSKRLVVFAERITE